MKEELKVSESVFEETISSLIKNLSELNETFNMFKSASEDMKGEWIGTGGNAYGSTCNLINSKFEKAIKDLGQEITDLISYKQSIVNEEEYLAGKCKITRGGHHEL